MCIYFSLLGVLLFAVGSPKGQVELLVIVIGKSVEVNFTVNTFLVVSYEKWC